jgi:hypothetical protein
MVAYWRGRREGIWKSVSLVFWWYGELVVSGVDVHLGVLCRSHRLKILLVSTFVDWIVFIAYT